MTDPRDYPVAPGDDSLPMGDLETRDSDPHDYAGYAEDGVFPGVGDRLADEAYRGAELDPAALKDRYDQALAAEPYPDAAPVEGVEAVSVEEVPGHLRATPGRRERVREPLIPLDDGPVGAFGDPYGDQARAQMELAEGLGPDDLGRERVVEVDNAATGTREKMLVVQDEQVVAEVPGAADGGAVVVMEDNRWGDALKEILAGRATVAIGALILALIAGSIMIAFTNEAVRQAATYLFARPGDFFSALGQALFGRAGSGRFCEGAYPQLICGSIWNFDARDFASSIRPLMDTLAMATPLIVAGLGVAVTFKAGLFNIGGRGQMIMGAIGAGWLAFALRGLPFWIHLIVALLLGLLLGALWGAIAGLLKAKFGAHEVISTIMLNYVAFYLLQYFLATPGLLQAPGSANPITPPTDSAAFPHLFGSRYPVRWSFVLALAAVAFCWWLMNRSTLGFAFRAVGENPRASRVAGINVNRMTITVFAIGGALLGLAGIFQVLGTITTGFTDAIDAGLGFDAITVALLGGSNPIGVMFAGLLFGAFKAGGSAMQAGERIPVEIVSVIQSLIVLFIAAPPLVRAIFRLPQPHKVAAAKLARQEAAAAAAAAAQNQVVTTP